MTQSSMMSVFHVNTSIRTSAGPDSELTHIHFAFVTSEVSSVREFAERLNEGRAIFGLRLMTRRVGKENVVKSKVATLLTRDGVAMVQDWTRGTLVEEEEPEVVG